MSLRAAVEKIVEDMKAEMVGFSANQAAYDRDLILSFRTHLKMLEMALKASEGESTTPQSAPVNPLLYQHDNTYHRVMIEKAKAEFAGKRETAEEGLSEDMMLLRGGPFDGDHLPVPSHMPEGAHTVVKGHVYTRKGKELHSNDLPQVSNS